MRTPPADLHAEPVAYWNGEAGDRWVRMAETMDPLLAPYHDGEATTLGGAAWVVRA